MMFVSAYNDVMRLAHGVHQPYDVISGSLTFHKTS
jgi:hypothetical protein